MLVSPVRLLVLHVPFACFARPIARFAHLSARFSHSFAHFACSFTRFTRSFARYPPICSLLVKSFVQFCRLLNTCFSVCLVLFAQYRNESTGVLSMHFHAPDLALSSTIGGEDHSHLKVS